MSVLIWGFHRCIGQKRLVSGMDHSSEWVTFASLIRIGCPSLFCSLWSCSSYETDLPSLANRDHERAVLERSSYMHMQRVFDPSRSMHRQRGITKRVTKKSLAANSSIFDGVARHRGFSDEEDPGLSHSLVRTTIHTTQSANDKRKNAHRLGLHQPPQGR